MKLNERKYSLELNLGHLIIFKLVYQCWALFSVLSVWSYLFFSNQFKGQDKQRTWTVCLLDSAPGLLCLIKNIQSLV